MNKIKFSHRYNKIPYSDWIPNQEGKLEAELFEVFIADKKELSDKFLEFDTSYFERLGSELIKKNYPLPSGKLIVLLLQSWNETGTHLWTTVRRWTPEKEKYYRSIRGQQVEIVVSE